MTNRLYESAEDVEKLLQRFEPTNGMKALFEDEKIKVGDREIQVFAQKLLSSSGKHSIEVKICIKNNKEKFFSEGIPLSIGGIFSCYETDENIIKISRDVQKISEYLGFKSDVILLKIADKLKQFIETADSLKYEEKIFNVFEKYVITALLATGITFDYNRINETCSCNECYVISLREFRDICSGIFRENNVDVRKEFFNHGLLKVSSNSTAYPLCIPARIKRKNKEFIGKAIALRKYPEFEEIIQRVLKNETEKENSTEVSAD